MPPAFFFTGSFSGSSLYSFISSERFTYSLTHRASLRWRHTLTNDIGLTFSLASFIGRPKPPGMSENSLCVTAFKSFPRFFSFLTKFFS
jgi:hypothetical protein